MKICECGCGNEVSIAEYDNKKTGQKRGRPFRFVRGHNNSKRYKGRTFVCGDRTRLFKPDHPRANVDGYVSKSIFIATVGLGKQLPPKAVVHHFDEDTRNDSNNNLVVCQDTGYHQLLHQRKRAHDACGNTAWRKCSICKQYDETCNLCIYPRGDPKMGGTVVFHRYCKNIYQNKRRRKIAVEIKTVQELKKNELRTG